MTDVLLIGLGSVGKRHLAAATQLGYKVVGVDPKPLQYLSEEVKGIELHHELTGLRGRRFDYCVIANWDRTMSHLLYRYTKWVFLRNS